MRAHSHICRWSIKSTYILIIDTDASDHLAISLTVKAQAKSTTVPEAEWDKADLGLYRHMMSGLLSQVKSTEALCCSEAGCQNHVWALEAYYYLDLISCLHDAANMTVSKVNFNTNWWTEELDQLNFGQNLIKIKILEQ